ncbi:hypothetical protein B0H13DRAFT_1864684 [Mycena leptocephala]|nr:hypothetical protein B0H13DRAFT_1864684 [Mycena leptocephala]
MQENTSNGFGSISPWSWNDDDANNSFGQNFMKPIADAAFSLDNPHQQLFLPTKDDVANNSSGEDFSTPIPDAASCYALSLDNLHQRLLWAETAVLGWQLERNHQSIPPMFNEAGGCVNSDDSAQEIRVVVAEISVVRRASDLLRAASDRSNTFVACSRKALPIENPNHNKFGTGFQEIGYCSDIAGDEKMGHGLSDFFVSPVIESED